MISLAVASRYAGALVDVVTSPATRMDPADAVAQLRSFAAALNTSLDLRLVLSSPAVSPARKRAVVRRIADQLGLAPVIRNFLLVLSDHRRGASVDDIIDQFDVMLDARLGLARVQVQSARDIDQGQKARLTTGLARLTGKQVRMQFSVDPALIGGLVARIGSTVYDGSVRGQLDSLGRKLGAE
jgi:F-type H+-transporting ATPase subunit delta